MFSHLRKDLWKCTVSCFFWTGTKLNTVVAPQWSWGSRFAQSWVKLCLSHIKVFCQALHNQHYKLSEAPSSGSSNLNSITVLKKNKWVHQNPHTVVLCLVTLLKNSSGLSHTPPNIYTHLSGFTLESQATVRFTDEQWNYCLTEDEKEKNKNKKE